MHDLSPASPWSLLPLTSPFPSCPQVSALPEHKCSLLVASVASPGPSGALYLELYHYSSPSTWTFPECLVSVTIFHLPVRQIWPACFFYAHWTLTYGPVSLCCTESRSLHSLPWPWGQGCFPYSSLCLPLSTVPATEKGLINICGWNVWKSGIVFGTV